jgi:hypothetical protein
MMGFLSMMHRSIDSGEGFFAFSIPFMFIVLYWVGWFLLVFGVLYCDTWAVFGWSVFDFFFFLQGVIIARLVSSPPSS